MASHAHTFASGRLIAGRYRLDEPIGQGGTSVVWSATHLISTRRVALKFLLPERANDEQAIARVYREAKAASLPVHEGIVPIVDVFVADGSPVLVMDLLEGESLRSLLDREHKLTPQRTIEVLVQVCDAVAAAHAAGVVHRDLKPENIFLVKRPTGPSTARILDFGIAKLPRVEGDKRALTSTGALLGTPYYMAPEQAFGERDIDHRADVWSLGVVAYECLSGERPTEAESFGQVLKILTQRDFTPLARLAPELPLSLVKIVDDMLQVEREKRLSQLSVLSARLRAVSFVQPRVRWKTVAAAAGLASVLVAAGVAASIHRLRENPPSRVAELPRVAPSFEPPSIRSAAPEDPPPAVISPPAKVAPPATKPSVAPATSGPRVNGGIVVAPPF